MHVAMYKAPGQAFNWLTRKWVRSPYSHGEIVVFDQVTRTSYGLSSSFRDGGVRIKPIVFKRENWDFVDLRALKKDPAEAQEYTRAKRGVGYDVRGVLRFGPGPIKQDPFKEFCTEFCAGLLGWSQAWRFDPGAFAARLVDVINEAEGNDNLSIDGAGYVHNKAGILVPEFAV